MNSHRDRGSRRLDRVSKRIALPGRRYLSRCGAAGTQRRGSEPLRCPIYDASGVKRKHDEVIGAPFGWLNVIGGRVYNVGDRIEIGTVRGDVLDITPLRTKVLEIGSDPQLSGDGPTSWVGARQPPGRVVAVSNKKTFTDPVFNYSAHLDWVWEELSVAIPQGGDWRAAEQALAECVREFRPAAREHGEAVLQNPGARYPLDRADVRTRTFIRLSGSDVEITARFVTPVRTSRFAKDEILRRVLERFERDGIVLAHPTYSVEIGAAPRTGRRLARARGPHAGRDVRGRQCDIALVPGRVLGYVRRDEIFARCKGKLGRAGHGRGVCRRA